MSAAELHGWDRLRHGGLLFDPPRLCELAAHGPTRLDRYHERELRKLATAVLDGSDGAAGFVTFVLERVCGFSAPSGTWWRGSAISPEWGRTAITGETVKPRQLWKGPHGAVLPVFLDREKRLGVGRGRRATSQVLQWLRVGSEPLAPPTARGQRRARGGPGARARGPGPGQGARVKPARASQTGSTTADPVRPLFRVSS